MCGASSCHAHVVRIRGIRIRGLPFLGVVHERLNHRDPRVPSIWKLVLVGFCDLNQGRRRPSCKTVLTLAYQSLGVVYGDLSTSPLYVYKTTFSGKLSLHEDDEEVFGVLSFIFWTLTLIPLFKYIYFVLSADDNGEGGPFALYSLLCRHANLCLLPNQQAADESLSTYNMEGSADTWQSSMLKELFKKHPRFRNGLLIVVLLGTCMTIGDGVLTPTISGAETMFANLGHFSALSIKMAFSFLVYPCLILAYMGEAAFLSKHHEDIQRSFYKAIPGRIYCQWFITYSFHCIRRCDIYLTKAFSIYRSCFLASLHSGHSCGNSWKSGCDIGNLFYHKPVLFPELLPSCENCPYFKPNIRAGFAVTIVIFVTTCLMSLVIIIAWKQKIMMAIAFLVFFGSVELLYISASLIKIPEGGWIPIVLSMIFMSVMYIWNYGTLKKHEFDLENKVSVNRILALGSTLGMVRVPGIGLVYADLVTGVPAVFGHFAANLPAFHQILVFVCIKSVQVPFVSEGERFLIGRIGPKEFHMFRCIVRYGYKDLQQDNYDFENILVSKILAFVEMEDDLQTLNRGKAYELRVSNPECPDIFMPSVTGQKFEEDLLSSSDAYLMKPGEFRLMEGSFCKDESLEILKAKESGVVYILGQSYARAKKSSSLIKKFVIDVIYAFLSNNCRGPDDLLKLPHSLLLEVGMVYHV
ncbi:hypothetical protein COCNU_04G013710 [Cocos nucifera]|uniref:Potassium transporter n=1 Tax=Cocos nucifera TaxID=13894 RepID=A0A8K0N0I0_COCNU|nr:hypothetical protein COCNU_04G013710 [Cocos nucifera]